ncbi:MAG: hypothetical protein DI536_03615 [Archangium gephyra]|uniref:histidine kinase n=1 Tax=Archangium gephyra TaxID=48 RepID=A0A2W5TVV1_9BACT|nr:MAG: hypothetical protein DI536_03615 [Archangium gephyra]
MTQTEQPRAWWVTAALTLGLAVAYAVTGASGLELASQPGNVTAVWLPAGLALAALLKFGRTLWPGITLGSFACNVLVFPAPDGTLERALGSLAIALSSTTGLTLIAWLVERRGSRDALASPSDLLRFMGLSLVGCVVNACGGLLATAIFSQTPPGNWLNFWATWVLGDFAGVVVVTSLVLGEGSARPRRVVESLFVFALSLVLMQLVFGRPIPGVGGTSLPVSWTVMIGAVWAGARLGGRAVGVMSLMNFFLMSWATLSRIGPFGHFERHTALLLTDCVAVLGTTVGLLLVSSEARSRRNQEALELERRHLEEKVQERTAQLELSSDALLSEAEERGRLASHLIEAQKQEALGRLAGGVAHDFNNLLTVISAEAELLRRDKEHNHDVHDAAGAILAASHRAAELTRQLLAVARRQPTTPRYVELADTLAANRRLLRPLLPANITLEVQCDDDCGVSIDPTMLDQIVLNLALNARDAIQQRPGKVNIIGSKRTLGEQAAASVGLPPGRWVTLEVEDDGDGIPPEILDRIFEPFFTTKGDGRGTGLGLSTVWGIASQARGKVTVDSSSTGTRFTAWLPAAERPSTPIKASAAPAFIDGRPSVILVVEDEPLVRRTVVLTLERAGHQVLTAADGDEALAVLEIGAAQVHLVLTDVVMPRRGGVELAREVRARWQKPVIFMSGFHERQSELTDELVLGKPFSTDQLLAAVSQALRTAT